MCLLRCFLVQLYSLPPLVAKKIEAGLTGYKKNMSLRAGAFTLFSLNNKLNQFLSIK